MELTSIKGSLFGYSKKAVCEYITELNELQEAELKAQKENAENTKADYEEKLSQIKKDNDSLSQKVASLEEEIASLKASYEELKIQKEEADGKYDALEAETLELRNKSDVISTAIINAEKCATTMINDASVRATEMIGEAESKVETEVARLETAKGYISEVRDAVEVALKKIDAELSGLEGDIDYKKADIYSDEKKNTVKEKFGMLFKKA